MRLLVRLRPSSLFPRTLSTLFSTLTPTSPFSVVSYRSFSAGVSLPIPAGGCISAIFSGHHSLSTKNRYNSQFRVSLMSTGAGAGAGGAEDSRGLVEFKLSSSSYLKIQKGDITQWFIDGSKDAIVNAANERMLGGGGVDGAIHRAAGPELKEACYKVPEVHPGVRCPTGEARITPGFKLPASHVIHTVGPIYDVDKNPSASLKNAYRNSLRVAKENNIQYVAFPAISCGVFRFPYDEAASIAISTIKEHADDFKEVHFVLFSDDIYEPWMMKAKEILGN